MGNETNSGNNGSGGYNTLEPSTLSKTGQVVLIAIIGTISIIGIIKI